MKESPRARQAWADYLALGPDRSLEKLLAHYQRRTGSVPTRQLSRLKRWSTDHGWQSRLAAIADAAAKEAAEAEATYRRSILEEGFGLAHERVKALKALAAELLDDVTRGGRRWLPDVKQIGSGEMAERVDLERFNASEVEQLRGLLDDIAREKGDRKAKHELTGKDGGPIQTQATVIVLPDNGRGDRQPDQD